MSKSKRKDEKDDSELSNDDNSSSRCSSPEDSDSDSNSRSRSRERKEKSKSKKHSKSKKEKKSKSEKKKSKKKKDKKSKKDKKDNKSQKPYGYYGIITKDSLYDKKEEFQAWVQEVKHLNIESLNQFEEKRLFEDYCEDYNTATLPNKKYYSLAIWEQMELNQKYKEEKKKQQKQQLQEFNFNGDEEQKRILRQQQAQQYEREVLSITMRQLHSDKNLAKVMQQQKNENTLMAQSYKRGDQSVVDELKSKKEKLQAAQQGTNQQQNYQTDDFL